MPETAAQIGYGSIFEISTNDGATWTKVGEVMAITPPSDEIDVLDATHMESPDRTREFITGLRDPGEASFEMNFVPGSAGDTALQAVRDAGERIRARITFPNAVIWTFSAILTGYEPDVPLDDKMTASVTFKVTSSYEVTAAAAPTNVTLPAISGIAQVGEVLTALEGAWTAARTFAYQWQVDAAGNGTFANVTGATARTYTPVAADETDRVRVIVTATNSEGSASATSAATAATLAA